MAAYTLQASAAGPTATSIPINLRRFKFGVGLIVNFSSGASATVNVEVTGQQLNQGQSGSSTTVPAAPVWNLHDTLQGLTASKNSSLAYPCTAIRLNVTNYSSGTITLYVIEAEG